MAAAHDGIAVASERSERAQQSMERRLETVQRKYDEVYRSQQSLAQVERTLASAQQQGLITMQRRVELLSMAAERHGLATSAINREIAATERLADVQRMQVAANSNMRGGGNFNNANAAFQIQDIAMMSMMGQAPMMTALQQGPQLAMAMEAGGGLKSLAAGLASLINPTMLITVGLTAATAAAVQFFMNMKSGSADSEEALKKQNELIASVAAKWGDALPGLKAYNDELTRQKDLSDALEASTAARSQQYIEERSSVVDLTIDLDDLINRLQILGGDPTQIVELQAAFANLQAKVKDSTATADDALAVQKELNDLMGTGLPIVGEYATKFGELAGQIGKAASAAEKFDLVQKGSSLFNRKGLESILGALDPLNGFRQTPFQTEEDIMFARSRPGSTQVGATGTMTNVNGVNVHQYMSETAEYTEASADYLRDINSRLPGYFSSIDETLKNDVTGSIAKFMGQMIYAQTLAAQTVADAVNTSILTGQSTGGGGSWDGRRMTFLKRKPQISMSLYDPETMLESGTLAEKYYKPASTSGGLSINYAGMFAEGGEFTVPGQSTGDRTLVSFRANGGETVKVSKADEYGGASVKHFHLHYTPAPGDSDATTEQRARKSFGVMMQEAVRE
ncbi:phage tail length tape measure family protein [Mesorhizobium sp. KR9-304]|uniref:phage tail length tape measure family protein n=1 Tax=Mesorhizobium sp. KR9-304 TaxID=3156614 RepID=UPI0032B472B8